MTAPMNAAPGLVAFQVQIRARTYAKHPPIKPYDMTGLDEGEVIHSIERFLPPATHQIVAILPLPTLTVIPGRWS